MAQLLVRRTLLALLVVSVILGSVPGPACAAGGAKKNRAQQAATDEAAGTIAVAGLVTNRRRESVAGAKIVLFAGTQVVGTATTDAGGAFSIGVTTVPDSVRVSAKDYTAVKVNVLNPTGIIVVLKPKGSSSRKGHAESDDLPILPYNDLGYAQSLRTFTTIRGGQFIRIADRGLGGNVIGAAGKSFADVPARYASYVSPIDANQAYRTNANGATGQYLVGADSPEPAGGEFELGSLKTVDLQATALGFDIVAGDSRGDGTTRTRSDLTYRGPLARGALWATGYYASASQDARALGNTVSYGKINYQHPFGEMTATFETTLRQKIVTDDRYGVRLVRPASTYTNQLRLKDSAGDVSWEFGIITSRQNASVNLQLPENSTNLGPNSAIINELVESDDADAVPFGTLAENRVYAEARYAGSRTDFNAGLGAVNLSLSGTDGLMPADKQTASALQPSIQVTQRVGRRLSFVGGQSSGIETPRISRRYFGTSTPPPTFLTRTYLTEAAARYEIGDSFNAEIQEYKEIRNTPLYSTILVGTGYSADWRISRIFHIRAWSLLMHTAYYNAGARGKPPQPTPARDVAFLTYAPSERIRADVIYRHETDPLEQGRFIDWDTLYKFNLRTGVTASYEHHRTYSTFGAGLRVTTP